LDLTAPEGELVVGELFFDESITGVAIAGDRGFAATRYRVAVVDLTNPAVPTQIAELGGFTHDAFVRISGDLLVRHGFETLTIIDVGNPSTPVVASQQTGLDFSDLRVVGSRIFAAADAVGLVVIDVADPTDPQQIGSLPLGGFWEARHLDVAGDLAYIRGYNTSSYEAKLFVVDVSDPAHPSLSWDLDLVDNGGEVDVEGGHAFIAGGGLQVYDIGDPSTAQWVGSLEPTCYSRRSMSTVSDRALMTCEHAGLSIIDTTLPSSPTEIANITVPGDLWNGDSDHGILALASMWNGFRLIDVSDPLNPLDHGVHSLGLDVVDVSIAGDTLHAVGYGNHGYDLIDISDPTDPTLLGTADGFGGEIVEVLGDLVFVAAFSGSLHILDVSNPLVPISVGSLAFPGASWHFMASSGDLVVLRDEAFTHQAVIVDVSDPFAPAVVSVIDAPYTGGVAFFGRFLLLGDAILRIFDLSDPASPLELPQYAPFGGPTYLGAVEVSGSVAYLNFMPQLWDQFVAAVNIGNLQAPVLLGSAPISDRYQGIAIGQDVLFAITARTGFDTLALCHDPLFTDGFESGDTSAWSGSGDRP
ncbi:MAG: hypothetical protein AB1Z65_04430, partial [Candidatus Sulfomarinibacteraceae bacterium]